MADEPQGVADERRVTTELEAPRAGEEQLGPHMAAAKAAPVEEGFTWEQVKALGRYMTHTEVHTYAFSVAAQVILSLFPFIILLLTLSRRVFHSQRMVDVVTQMMMHFLPNNQKWVMDQMRATMYAHPQVKVFSVFMLLVTTTGVFLPLEVALNSVWGVTRNRSYLQNQVVSLGLAAGVATLAIVSIAMSAAQQAVLTLLFFGHTDNIVFQWIARGFLGICAVAASIALYFLIYWGLPNRKVPPMSVLPTAVVVGVLWEAGKYIYILVLPHLDFRAMYGPFEVSVGLIMWAFLSGLLLLAGAYVSATRQALREARAADVVRGEE